MDEACPNCGGEYVPTCPCGDGPHDWQPGDLGRILAERDRLRAVVDRLRPFLDHETGCAVDVDYPCNCGLDLLFAQLDVSGPMGGRADVGLTVSSETDVGEHPRTSEPTTDVRRGGGWQTAGLVDLAGATVAHEDAGALTPDPPAPVGEP
jgi:hypothetical protein